MGYFKNKMLLPTALETPALVKNHVACVKRILQIVDVWGYHDKHKGLRSIIRVKFFYGLFLCYRTRVTDYGFHAFPMQELVTLRKNDLRFFGSEHLLP